LLGPVTRSYARMRAAAARELSRSGMAEAGALAGSGCLTVALAPREAAEQPGPDALTDALRYALFRRGLAVAGNSGGFEPFDLQIVLGPICRVALNTLWEENGPVALRWRLGAAPLPIAVAAALMLVLCAAGRWVAALTIAGALLAWVAALTIPPLTRLPATLRAALIEAADHLRWDANIVSEGA